MTYQLQVAYLGSGNLFGRIVTTFLRQFPSVLRLNIYGCSEQIFTEDHGGHCRVHQFAGREQLPAALEGIDIVVIGDESNTVEPSRESVHYIASKVFDYAYFTGLVSPKAMVVVSASPLNLMLPLMGHVLQDLGFFDGRKLLGVTSEETLRANPLLAEYTGVDETILPVVGGASPQTRVPLFSQARPQVELKEEDKHKLIEDIKSFDLIYPREEIVAERAYATIRLLRALIQGLENSKNPITEMAMTKTSLVPDTTYFSLPVELGQTGVQRVFGLPVLQGIEEELLEYAVINLNHDLTRAFDIFKGLKHNLEVSSDKSTVIRKKYTSNNTHDDHTAESSFTIEKDNYVETKKKSTKFNEEELTNGLASLQVLEKLGYDETKMLSAKKCMANEINTGNQVNLNFIDSNEKYLENSLTLKQSNTDNEMHLNKKLKSTKLIHIPNNKNLEPLTNCKYTENVINNKESSFKRESYEKFKSAQKVQIVDNNKLEKLKGLSERKISHSEFFGSFGVENADLYIMESLGKSIEDNLCVEKEYYVHTKGQDKKSVSSEGKLIFNCQAIKENEKCQNYDTTLSDQDLKMKSENSDLFQLKNNIKVMPAVVKNSSETIDHTLENNLKMKMNPKQMTSVTYRNANELNRNEIKNTIKQTNYERNVHQKKMNRNNGFNLVINQDIKTKNIKDNFNLDQSQKNNETKIILQKTKEEFDKLIESDVLDEKLEGPKELQTTDEISASIFEEISQSKSSNSEKNVYGKKYRQINTTDQLKINHINNETNLKNTERNVTVAEDKEGTQKLLAEIERMKVPFDCSVKEDVEEETRHISENSKKYRAESNTKDNFKLGKIDKSKIINKHGKRKQHCNNQSDSKRNESSSSQEVMNLPPTTIKTIHGPKLNYKISDIACNQSKEDFEAKLKTRNTNEITKNEYNDVNKMKSGQVEDEKKVVCLMNEKFVNHNTNDFYRTNLEEASKKTISADSLGKEECNNVCTNKAIKSNGLVIRKYNNIKKPEKPLPTISLDIKNNFTMNTSNVKLVNTSKCNQERDMLKYINCFGNKYNNKKDHNLGKINDSQLEKREEFGKIFQQFNRKQIKTLDFNTSSLKKNSPVMSNIDMNYESKKSGMLSRRMCSKIRNSIQEKEIKYFKNNKKIKSLSENVKEKTFQEITTFDNVNPLTKPEETENNSDDDNLYEKMKNVKKENSQNCDLSTLEKFNEVEFENSNIQNIVGNKSYRKEKVQKPMINEERGFPVESKAYENKQSENLSFANESETNVTFLKNECENCERESKLSTKKGHEDYKLLKSTADRKFLYNEKNMKCIGSKMNKDQNISIHNKFHFHRENPLTKLKELNIPKETNQFEPNDQKKDQLPKSKISSNKLEKSKTFKKKICSKENEKMEQAKRKLKFAIKYNAPMKHSFNKEGEKIVNLRLNWANNLNYNKLIKNHKENILQSHDQRIKISENRLGTVSTSKKNEETNENLKKKKELTSIINNQKNEKTTSCLNKENKVIGYITEENMDKQTETVCTTECERVKNFDEDSLEYSKNVSLLENDLMSNTGENIVLGKGNQMRIYKEPAEEIIEKNSLDNCLKKECHSNDPMNSEVEEDKVDKSVVEDKEKRDLTIQNLSKETNNDKTENSIKKLSGQVPVRTENVLSDQISQIGSSDKPKAQKILEVNENLTLNSLKIGQKSKSDTKENIQNISPSSDINKNSVITKTSREHNQHIFLKALSKSTPGINKYNSKENKTFMKRYTILKKGEITSMIKEDINADECKARVYEQYAKKNNKHLDSDKKNSSRNIENLKLHESPFGRNMDSTVKLRKGPSTIIFDRISKRSQSSKTTEKFFGIRRSHNLSLASVNQDNNHETKNLTKKYGDTKNQTPTHKKVDFLKIAKSKLNLTKIIYENKKKNSKPCSIQKYFRDNSAPKINSINTNQKKQLINNEFHKYSTSKYKTIKKIEHLEKNKMIVNPNTNKKAETEGNINNDSKQVSHNISLTNKNHNDSKREVEKEENLKISIKSITKTPDQSKKDKIDDSKALEIYKHDNIKSHGHNGGSTFLNGNTQSREINEKMKVKKNYGKNSFNFDCEEMISKCQKETEQTKKSKLIEDTNKMKKKYEVDNNIKNDIYLYQKTEKNFKRQEIKTHNESAVVKSKGFLKTQTTTGDSVPIRNSEKSIKYLKSNFDISSNSFEKKNTNSLAIKKIKGKNNDTSNLKNYSKNLTESCIKKCKSNNNLASLKRLNLQEIPNVPCITEKVSSKSISRLTTVKPNYLRWSSKSLKTKQNIGTTKILDYSKKPDQKLVSNKNSIQKLLTDNNNEKLKMTANIFKDYMYKSRNITANNQQKYFNNSVKKCVMISKDLRNYNVYENTEKQLSIAAYSSVEGKCDAKKSKKKNLGYIDNITNSENNTTYPEEKEITATSPQKQIHQSGELNKHLTQYRKTEHPKGLHFRALERNIGEKLPQYTPSARNFLDLSPAKIITPIAQEKIKPRKIHLLKAHQDETSNFKCLKKSDKINIKYKSEADLLENNKDFFTLHNPIALLRKENVRHMKPMAKYNQLMKFKSEEKLPSSRVENHLPSSSSIAVLKKNGSSRLSSTQVSPEGGPLKKQLSKLFYMFQSVIKN